MFGRDSSNSLFGNAPSLFSSSGPSPFGNVPPSTTAFGNQSSRSFRFAGVPPSTPAFGNSTPAFGNPTPAYSSSFGFGRFVGVHPTTPSPAFGQPSPGSSGFETSGNSLFVEPNLSFPGFATGGGPATTSSSNEGQVVYDADKERIASISATDSYSNKSHEELRAENYKHQRNEGVPLFGVSKPLSNPFLSSTSNVASFTACPHNSAPSPFGPSAPSPFGPSTSLPPSITPRHHNWAPNPSLPAFEAFHSPENVLKSKDPWSSKSFNPGGGFTFEAHTKAQTSCAHTRTDLCQNQAPAPSPNQAPNVNLNGQGLSIGASSGAALIPAFVNCIIPAFGAFGLNNGSSGSLSLNPLSGTTVGFPVLVPTTLAFIPLQPQVSGPSSGLPTPPFDSHTNPNMPQVFGFNGLHGGQSSNFTLAHATGPGLSFCHAATGQVQGNPRQSTSLFGSQSTSPFGSQPILAFGSQSTPLFGSQSTPPFGSQSPSPFSSQPTPSFIPAFGSQSTPAFGSQSTPAFGSQSTINDTFAFPATTGAFGEQNSNSSISAPLVQTALGIALTSNPSYTADPRNALFSPSMTHQAKSVSDPDSSIPKGLELIVQNLGVNPWEDKRHFEESQAKQILPCEDASNDADIIALAEFAVQQHNAMDKDGKVEFSKVEVACLEAVDGGRYHIVLEAKKAAPSPDQSARKFYAAVLRKKTDRPNHLTLLEKWVPGV